MKLTKEQRAELKLKYGGRCAYCGELLGAKWQADHIKAIVRDFDFVKCKKTGNHIPKANGTLKNPENDTLENLNPSCSPCNNNKKSMSLDAWRRTLTHYRDVQVIRDCSQIRHLLRFGQVEFKHDTPIIFYFETLIPEPQDGVYRYLDRVVLNHGDIDNLYVVIDSTASGLINVKVDSKAGYHFTDVRSWSFSIKPIELRHATAEEIEKKERINA